MHTSPRGRSMRKTPAAQPSNSGRLIQASHSVPPQCHGFYTTSHLTRTATASGGWRYAVVAYAAPAVPSASPVQAGHSLGAQQLSVMPVQPFFDELCHKGAHEETLAWVKLRWCSNWQQVRALYGHFLIPSASSVSLGSTSGSAAPVSMGLGRDDTYAFLLQLQDFFHAGACSDEMSDMLAFRSQLVDNLCQHIRVLDAEQLECVCCISATTSAKWTRQRSDAVQSRLIEVCRGPEAVTPVINAMYALCSQGQLPQVALLQRLFRVAVDNLCDMTPSQWQALNRVARKFRFLVDETWLDDLNARLNKTAGSCSDFGRMLGIAGTLTAFVANGTAEMLDTRVATSFEVLERRFDVGRTLMTDQQLCQFTALLCSLRSHYFTKWQRHVKAQLTSCTTHLHSLSPGTVMLGVDLVVKGEGWREPKVLLRLMRHVVDHFASRPTLHNAVTVAEWLLRHSQSKPTSCEDPEVPIAGLRRVATRLASVNALEGLELYLLPRLLHTLCAMEVQLPQQWVDEVYSMVASRCAQVDSGTLVAMINGVHLYRLQPSLVVLEPLWREYARYLPLMRPVEMLRLFESWVSVKYLPEQATLEGFLSTVASLLIMERHRAPTAASAIVSIAHGTPSPPRSRASSSSSSSPISSSSQASSSQHIDTTSTTRTSVIFSINNIVRAPPPTTVTVTVTPQGPPTLPSTILSTDEAPDPPDAPISTARGIVLSPAEAQRLLSVLEQYREMLKEVKRRDLVSVMNMYRNQLTAALYDMKKDQQAAGSDKTDKDRHTARLLQSLLHGKAM